MAEEQSWKDIRNQRRKENFVGRGDEVRVFTENFVTLPKYMVFAVTGEGGVGKSTLLKRFAGIATAPEIDAIAITCDDRQTSPVAAMGHIATELSKLGISHKEFDERYKTYLQLRQEIESDPKVSRSAVKVISMGVTDFTIKSLRKTPGVGVFFEYADEKAVGEALGEAIQYGINKWGNKDEVQLLREPEGVLTPLFLKLIQKACEKKRLVIMLDVLERTGAILTSWLLALFNFEYGEFGTKLSFVISGRDLLDQQWTDLAGMICYIHLEPFTLDETKLYLINQEITDDQLVNQIYKDTSGLPVLVELLAATKPQPGHDLPDISKDAVDRFLQWTPQEEKRHAVLLASVPRQFNRDILSAVLGLNAGNIFSWLAEQSYIRRSLERGWFYHEKVRELMLRHLSTTTPSELTGAHTRLVTFFTFAQTELKLGEEEAYKNENWRGLEIERVYHCLSGHTEQNISETTNAFLYAFRWRLQFSESIARLCLQVSNEKGSKSLRKWADDLISLYEAYSRDEYEIVIEKLNLLEKQRGISPIANAILLSRRGDTYSKMQKYDEALISFSLAIQFDDKNIWAITRRGITFLRVGKYQKALDDFTHAIKLDNRYVDALVGRGGAYELLDQYEEALADLNRAIELDNQHVEAIAHCGQIYRSMKRYEEALAKYTLAIEIDDKQAWVFVGRGYTFGDMLKYDEALSDFNRAIELDEKAKWNIVGRGSTYRMMGRYEEALADFNRLIEANDKDIWVLTYRGQTYRMVKKYDEALADFNRALEIDNKYIWALAQRGVTYQQMEKYTEALIDFNRAVELDEKTAWVINNRGEVYQSMGRYEEALADFNRAIEVDDKYVWAYTYRGNVYNLMGKYEESLADITRGIELGDKSAWAFASRGNTYLSMGKFDEALSDINHAIELDKKLDWAYLVRGETYRLLLRFDESMQDLTRSLERNTDRLFALSRRAAIFLAQGNKKSAQDDLDQAVSLETKNPYDHYNRAVAFVLLEKNTEALEEFKLAFEDDLFPRVLAQTDDLLDNIRKTKKFQALLNKYK